MALNLARRSIVVALLISATLAGHVVATFAASPGFSGRAGITCIACHTPAAVPVPAAQAILEGVPATWNPGDEYLLAIRIEGGPQAMPAPQPQGGFDISVGAGSLRLPPGTEQTLRLVGTQEVTYLPAGTLMRQWEVIWVAPGLDAYPEAVPIWLAVVAANGNHVVATNASDGGELLDATADLQVSIPPSASALASWRSMPLLAPSANATRGGAGTWMLDGQHRDGNATRLLWSVDGGSWQARDTAATWKLVLTGLDGDHSVRIRSEGSERASSNVTLELDGPGLLDGVGGGKSTPNPIWIPVAGLVALLWLRRETRS